MSKTSSQKMSIDSQIKKCIEWMKNEEVSDQVMRWVVENNMHKAHRMCKAHISAKCFGTDRSEKFHGNVCNECHYYERKQKRKELKRIKEEREASNDSSSEEE